MAGLPLKTIVVWYYDNNIPADWQLCDGTNGTPDLRGGFPMGASIDGDVGVTGGANTHTHTNPANVTTAGNHGHNSAGADVGGNDSSTNVVSGTGDSCSPDGHGHSFTPSFGDDSTATHTNHTLSAPTSANNLPLHIKLYYIMKMA